MLGVRVFVSAQCGAPSNDLLHFLQITPWDSSPHCQECFRFLSTFCFHCRNESWEENALGEGLSYLTNVQLPPDWCLQLIHTTTFILKCSPLQPCGCMGQGAPRFRFAERNCSAEGCVSHIWWVQCERRTLKESAVYMFQFAACVVTTHMRLYISLVLGETLPPG